MVFFVFLLLEIFVLFLLSRATTHTISKFVSVNLLSFLFLPGTIIHELSHMIIAAILFVPVGEMEFVPKKSGNGIKLGSVEIGKTDPIRRAVIGFAPVLAGLMLIITIVYFFSSNLLFFQDQKIYLSIVIIVAIIYLLFAISNTMFSSKKDMEGTVEILLTLAIVFIIVYIAGFRPQLSVLEKIFTKEAIEIVRKSAIFLLAPISIDLLILGAIKVIHRSRSRIA